MIWLGLTGGIACGKSAVARLFEGRGLPVLRADDLVHQDLGPGGLAKPEVIRQFGTEVLGPDGNIDRKKLGHLVFSDLSKLRDLEAILHPLVKKQAADWKDQQVKTGVKMAMYEVPLLYEKKMQDLFAGVIVVGCQPEVQLKRLMARDHLPELAAKQRIESQLNLVKKRELANWYIDNSGNQLDLAKKVEEIYHQVSLLPSRQK